MAPADAIYWQSALVVCGGVYAAALLWLLSGIGRVRRARVDEPAEWPALSVHVAARNEEAGIGACLDALARQDYPGRLEVIVVDDRSTDATRKIVQERAAAWPALKLVRAEAEPMYRCPKKSALELAVAAGSGELLLFTDADCQPAPGWARGLARRFAPGVGLVAGYAPHRPAPGWRNGLLALDNLAVAALSAGSIGMGAPLACTGRSLAFRRAVFDQVGGYSRIGHLLAGDDVYFMRLVGETEWRAAYVREEESAVWSRPGPKAWGAIIQQKTRHAAKGGHYSGPAFFLGLGVYFFHAALLYGAVRAPWYGAGLLAGVWAGRWALDALMLWRFAPSASERRRLRFLPLLELCYIPYVLILSVAGRLGLFRWK